MNKKQHILITSLVFCVVLFFMVNWSSLYNKGLSDTMVDKNIAPQSSLNQSDIVTLLEEGSTQDDLCKNMKFTTPSKEEIEYNELIKDESFVKYLRFTLNKFSEDDYLPCEEECPIPGLFLENHFEDTAYLDLEEYDKEMLKSKFIVLQTDIAVGGGASIVIIFKDYPDNLYYAWVYGEGEDYFDLRAFQEYSPSTSIEDVQKIFINQICDKEMGL